MSMRRWLTFVIIAAVLCLRPSAETMRASDLRHWEDQDKPPVPQFRSGVTAVPLNVRVVDRAGTPITDLVKEDFSIIEDGVPQAVTQFAVRVMTPGAAAPGVRARPDVQPFDASPQDNRVFLIVLGQRALGDPARHSETLDALVHFVRSALLPQDQVALLSYNRALDFTTDHERVARFLETFKGNAAGTSGGRQAPVSAPDASLFVPPEQLDPSSPIESELGFEDYVRTRLGQPLSELDSLFFGIKYLQFMPGEKHLIFVSERGPELTGALDQVQRLTRSATSARVALDTIQLGQSIIDTMPKGVPRPEPAPALVRRIGGEDPPTQPNRPTAESAPAFQGVENAVFDIGLKGPLAGLPGLFDLRYVASQTGGLSTTFKDAAPALARIDAASRTHYLLAYYPTNADWNGRYRSVKVQVNRPGAIVLYRHGYYAAQAPETFDRRRVVSSNRIESAGYQVGDVREIDVQMRSKYMKDPAGRGGEIVVELSVETSRLAWTVDADGRHVANVEVAIYASDAGGDNLKIVGETRRALDLKLTDETYEVVSKERFTRVFRVPVTGTPRYVKAIVYDYDADRVGSVMSPVK